MDSAALTYPTITTLAPAKPRKHHSVNYLKGIYKFETELAIIWKKVGRAPFLSSYVKSELGAEVPISQLTRALKSRGLTEDLGFFIKRDNRKLWKIKDHTAKYLEDNYGPVSKEIELACNENTDLKRQEFTDLHTNSYIKSYKSHKPDRDAAQRLKYVGIARQLYDQVGKTPFLFQETRSIILSPASLQILLNLGFISKTGTTRRGAGNLVVWQLTDTAVSELTGDLS